MKIKSPAQISTSSRSSGAKNFIEGAGVSPGIAIGSAFIYEAGSVSISVYKINKNKLSEEKQRFSRAVAAVSAEIGIFQEKARNISGAAGEEVGYLLDAYQQMLQGSRLVRGVERRIETEQINAEAAIKQEIEKIAAGFAAVDDPYLAIRVDDIREIGRRLTIHLTTGLQSPFIQLPKNVIILADNLSPADTALLDTAQVIGFVTEMGGTASHTAIMARSLEIPAIVGVSGKLSAAKNNDVIVLDGNEGRIYINPSQAIIEKYRKKRADFLKLRRQLHRLRKVPAVTRDGTEIGLYANLELPSEIGSVLNSGAAGIGLLRSEFFFMNRSDLPDEEEQYVILRDMIGKMAGRPLTIRTLDAGGEKLAPALGISKGPNPALGLRAIRLCLTRPEIIETQMAAILRAGVLGPVRVLLPMISGVEELRQVKEIWASVIKKMRKNNITIASPLPPLGVMIEVPGAALSADSIAGQADFFSIGTNDLTQYSLAIDRSDDAVAHLYDSCHPGVLRLVQFATEAALRARIPVSVCGEIAADPRFTPLLLGLGIRELSMASSSIPIVKQRILKLDMMAAIKRTHLVMDQSDGSRIRELIDDFNASTESGAKSVPQKSVS